MPITSVREANLLRILNYLRACPGCSRTQVATETGLSRATVSELVGYLINRGLVYENGAAGTNRRAGRPQTPLMLDDQRWFAAGIELTGSDLIAVMTDLYGKPIEQRCVPFAQCPVEVAADLLTGCVAELAAGHPNACLVGLGVGVPGLVDEAGATVIQSLPLGWVDAPLAPLLRKRTGGQVWAIKRQQAGALGEHRYGAGRGRRNLLFISVGVGIGSGIILDGNPYRGSNGSAGEIGHTTVVPDGAPCSCGNRGCLETVASTQALAARKRELAAAGAADAASTRQVLEEAGAYLGIAVANALNLFNPEMIILGGDIIEHGGRSGPGSLILEAVRATVRLRTLPHVLAGSEITVPALGAQAAAVGAAALAIDHFFATLESECEGGEAPR